MYSPISYDVNALLIACYYVIVEIDITRFMRTACANLFHSISLLLHLYASEQALKLFGCVTTGHLVGWLYTLGVSARPYIC